MPIKMPQRASIQRANAPVECTNTHDQLMHARVAGLCDIAITQRRVPSSSRSRPTFQSGWAVYSPGRDLREPGAKRAWYDHGTSRIFDEGMDEPTREQALIAAMNWVADKFGGVNWKRNRSHDYVAEQVARRFPLRKS